MHQNANILFENSANENEDVTIAAKQIANCIRLKCQEFLQHDNLEFKPEIAITCGSGLGNIVKELISAPTVNCNNHNHLIIPYASIPHMPISQVEGHLNQMVFGIHNGVQFLCFQGRVHIYEGFPDSKLTLIIRALHMLGIGCLFLTNVSGCISPRFKMGDIMVIRDHVDLPSLFGLWNKGYSRSKKSNVSTVYSHDLINLALQSANDLHLGDICRQGVYIRASGPNYETCSERAFFQRSAMGDAIGASTANEATLAHNLGIRVCGFSLITTNYENPDKLLNETGNQEKSTFIIDHNQLINFSMNEGAKKLGQILKRMIEMLAQN